MISPCDDEMIRIILKDSLNLKKCPQILGASGQKALMLHVI